MLYDLNLKLLFLVTGAFYEDGLYPSIYKPREEWEYIVKSQRRWSAWQDTSLANTGNSHTFYSQLTVMAC